MPNPLLEVSGLGVAYGELRAVDGVDFHLDRGELVSIVGANGAGKTSILNALMGLVRPSAGRVLMDGRDITGLPAYLRAREGVRLVPERARVFPRLSVQENLLSGVFGLRRIIDVDERMDWLFSLFPILAQRRRQAAATLSGGEQQQLAIARALISDPRLLLVDEVSMGLMPKLVDRVFDLLRDLNRSRGLSILLVEQNAAASLEISHRAYVLETGTVAHQGRAADLMNDPKVRAVYLGRE